MNDRYGRGDRNPPTPPSAGPVIPRVSELVAIDHQAKRINLPLLVLGAWADALMDHLFTNTQGRQRIDLAAPGRASMLYLPIQLGDIRGFTTHFHLYGFRDDARLVPDVTAHLPHAKGLVVTLGGSSAVTELAAKPPASVPVALLGRPQDRAGWAGRLGVAPAFEAESVTDVVFPAIKAVAKVMLSELRKA